MIQKRDILERAREWKLRPEVVEKDYVLGWLLAALAQHEEAATGWVLKGGTCVKKCFVETYRFSEDLDFTLLPGAPYDGAALHEMLRELTGIAADLSGLEFDANALAVRECVDRLGRRTYEGKIGYRGPLAVPGWPRVLFDLTQHESVIDEPVLRPVFHPYPDGPLDGTLVQTYSLEELLAEKTRALVERTRPRDLYDVVYIVDNVVDVVRLDHAREVFAEKCVAKQLTRPTAQAIVDLVTASAELLADWDAMLAHQLPQLLPAAVIVGRVADVVRWVDPDEVVTLPPEASVSASVAVPPRPPSVVAPPVLALGRAETRLSDVSPRVWGRTAPLEAVRFAGTNRVLVEFMYSGARRIVEPYSLRRSNRGNVLLYAWEIAANQIKAFDAAKIVDLIVTGTAFTPRYRIELTALGADGAVPLTSTSRGLRPAWRRPRRAATSGPVYVYTCVVCGREFPHRTRDASLRRHKDRGGYSYCSGRRGALARIE